MSENLPVSPGQLLSARSVYKSVAKKEVKVSVRKVNKKQKPQKKKVNKEIKRKVIKPKPKFLQQSKEAPSSVITDLSNGKPEENYLRTELTVNSNINSQSGVENESVNIEVELKDIFDKDDSFQLTYAESDSVSAEEEENIESFPEIEEQNSFHGVYQTLDKFDYVVMNSNEALLFMPFQTCFYFKGRLGLKIISGVAEMQGYALEQNLQKIHNVFSPRGYSLNCIRAVGKSKQVVNVSFLQTLLETAGLKYEESLLKEKTSKNIILIISSVTNGMIDYLNRVFPINILRKEDCLPSNWNEESRNNFDKMLTQLDSSVILRGSCFSGRFYLQPDAWTDYTQNLLEKLQNEQPVRLMLLGGKGVGKSTLLRFIVNQLIQACGTVLVIDFDPGQPEFTPTGCVSASLVTEPLLGPNFTHLQQPLYSYFMGHADISGCPERYVQSCRQLLNDCKLNLALSRIPTIVNTMGFIAGIGLDVTLDAIRLTQPHQIIQVCSRSERRNYPALLDRDYVNQNKRGWLTGSNEWSEELPDYELQAIYSSSELSENSMEEWGFRPSELRKIGLMSYFSKLSTSPEWSLMDTVPFCISWQDLAVCVCHESISPELVMAALNASMVALCVLDTDAIASIPYYQAASGNYPKILKEMPLMPCLGYGVIRAIDPSQGLIYLISPEPAETLARVNCLVMGEVQLPESVLLDAPILSVSREPRSNWRVPYGTFGPSAAQPACRPYRKHNPLFTLRNAT